MFRMEPRTCDDLGVASPMPFSGPKERPDFLTNNRWQACVGVTRNEISPAGRTGTNCQLGPDRVDDWVTGYRKQAGSDQPQLKLRRTSRRGRLYKERAMISRPPPHPSA